MAKRGQLTLVIEKIINTGKSLARTGGKVVLTDQGIPGETVEVEVVKAKKTYIEAITRKILSPSTQRVEPRCWHYRACSPYQSIDYRFQVKIKKEQINELFNRRLSFGGQVTFHAARDIWHYRNKIQLQVSYDNGRAQYAYHQPKDNISLVAVDRCFLASKAINNLLADLLRLIEENKISHIRQVAVRENSRGSLLLLVVYLDSLKNTGNINRLCALDALTDGHNLSGIVAADGKKERRIIVGRDHIETIVNNIKLYSGAESFFQVNTSMLEVLIADLKSCLGRHYATIADLYCGVGTFGLILADLATEVVAIEANAEEMRLLKMNIRMNKRENFTIHLGRCEDLKDVLVDQPIELLIVDPPRKGLRIEMCKTIIKSEIPKMVYISCDPATLVRDLGILAETYCIDTASAYDFFPQTAHIETMVILIRK